MCSLCGVEYCSTNCQITAFNKYHQTLCKQTKERIATHPLELLSETWKYVFVFRSNKIIKVYISGIFIIHQKQVL